MLRRTSVPPRPRILLVRTDRLGDVLLTTPLAGALKAHFPDSRIAWLAAPYSAPLLEHNPDIDELIVDQGAPVSDLARRLREGRFDVAVLPGLPPRATWAVRRAGIPVRVGPLKSLWGALLTRPVLQRRSRGDVHEADHNLQLLEQLGVRFRRVPTRLELTERERDAGRAALDALGCGGAAWPLVLLHPGGRGSASKWPYGCFLELGRRLAEAGAAVLLTSGPEEPDAVPTESSLPFLRPGSKSIRELAALLACADLVVSNSTGPLHMAVALGIPTLSVYPGVGTARPSRWGPYPAYPEGDPVHRVFIAPTNARGEPDMAAVSVDELWAECQARLRLR